MYGVGRRRSNALTSASRQGYVCTTCTMSYFYGNKSTFLWIALLSTDVLEEDPLSGEEEMFSMAPSPWWIIVKVHLNVMYESGGTPQGGLIRVGSWRMGSAVIGGFGPRGNHLFKHFSIKYMGTLFLFCFYFFILTWWIKNKLVNVRMFNFLQTACKPIFSQRVQNT